MIMKSFNFYPSTPIHDLREMLEKSGKLYAGKVAFYQKEDEKYRSFTYSQLLHDVNALGVALTRRGLEGKRIIIMGENSYAWCVAYLAAACGLGVAVPVDKEISSEELASVAKISGAGAIFYSEKYEEKAAKSGKRIQKIPFGEMLKLCEGEFTTEEYAAYRNISVDVDSLAVLIFTSGTTGAPKGVMLSHRNICSSLENVGKLVKLTSADIALSILPLHHAYECTAGFLFPISRGASVAFSEGVRHIMKNTKEIHPTKMLCVPLMLEAIHKKIWTNIRKRGIEEKVRNIIKLTDMIKPESVRFAAKRKAFAEIHASFGGKLDLLVSGGAPIDPHVLAGLRAFGFRVIQGYGLTECAPLVTVNPDLMPKDHSVGVALPGGELKISEPDTDGIGEICYRGDNVMMGYYKMPEETAAVKKSGWLATGDLGYIDEDGYLVIKGRKKNLIVREGGKRVYPEEIEAQLLRCPYVSECVVVGIMNDDKKDNDVVALVYPNFEYARQTLAAYASDAMIFERLSEAVSAVNAKLPSYKRIDMLLLQKDEFPKNSARKIKRVGLVSAVMDDYLAVRG